MFRTANSFAALAAASFLAVALSAAPARANHQWSDYHHEDVSAPSITSITITNQYCMGGNRLQYDGDTNNDDFMQVNLDWTNYIANNGGGEIALVSGNDCPDFAAAGTDPDDTAFNSAFNQRTGAYGPDVAFSFDGAYGSNGWLGLAVINLSADGTHHIAHGEVFLNTSYMGLSYYDTARDWRQVQCQEAGHILGLDHVKKDVSCMYSSRAFFGTTETPNNHDGEMVNQITHVGTEHDGGGTEEEEGGGGFCDKKPNHWRCASGAGGRFATATWAEKFANTDEMSESADLVVNGYVVKGSAFARNAGPAGRELPVSQVIIRVEDSLKGNAKAVLILEQTRGPGLEIREDPGYVAGDDYTLYLRQTGPNTYRTVSPAGRIRR